MTSSALKLWLQTNKYLISIFTLLLLIVIPLLSYLLSTNLPTILYYLGQGGFSRAEILMISTEQLDTLPDQKPPLISGKAYNQLKSTAKKTDYIEIGDCKPYPSIAHISIKATTVLLKNSTKKNHTISLRDGSGYTIQAQKELEIPANFIHTPSLYTYNCDGSLQPVGAFWVSI